jgi:hypothetical protein
VLDGPNAPSSSAPFENRRHSQAQREGEHIGAHGCGWPAPPLPHVDSEQHAAQRKRGDLQPMNHSTVKTTPKSMAPLARAPHERAQKWNLGRLATGSGSQRPGSRHRRPDLKLAHLGMRW